MGEPASSPMLPRALPSVALPCILIPYAGRHHSPCITQQVVLSDGVLFCLLYVHRESPIRHSFHHICSRAMNLPHAMAYVWPINRFYIPQNMYVIFITIICKSPLLVCRVKLSSVSNSNLLVIHTPTIPRDGTARGTLESHGPPPGSHPLSLPLSHIGDAMMGG